MDENVIKYFSFISLLLRTLELNFPEKASTIGYVNLPPLASRYRKLQKLAAKGKGVLGKTRLICWYYYCWRPLFGIFFLRARNYVSPPIRYFPLARN